MHIDKILNQSSKSIRAVVRVEPGEVADIEEMARLIDGDTGHFGFRANIVKVGDGEPEYSEVQHFGKLQRLSVKTQFGFADKSPLNMVRYYKVEVYRD